MDRGPGPGERQVGLGEGRQPRAGVPVAGPGAVRGGTQVLVVLLAAVMLLAERSTGRATEPATD
ncbi:hypothetical protein [Streptomyces sp. NRRL B-24484]|uniref:hypothetical protein n=1 Tax=Streptomyces sp. NRRL B-24484 TaxID=1463833 RepID=UPI0006946F05|nr:hypothetical protein [Streptomyces sp. NRRL B-24484]